MTTPDPTPAQEPQPLEPLWTYDSIGAECTNNATKKSRSGRNVSMDDIVKYAYETTIFTIVDQYEAERAAAAQREAALAQRVQELEQQLEQQLERARKWLPEKELDGSYDE